MMTLIVYVQILEVSYFDDKMERLDTVDQVKAAVEEMQQYGIIKNQLNKGCDSYCYDAILNVFKTIYYLPVLVLNGSCLI